jgi:hypothetical protein
MAIRPMTPAQRTAASPFSAYAGTAVSKPKAKKTPKGPGGRAQAQTFGYLTGGGASLPIPYTPPKKKAKKKAVPKNVVSVAPNERHRDMMGRAINQNDYVLAVQGNRPFPFKVLKLNDTTLTMVPAIDQKNIKSRVSGGSVPAYKTYRRECWNVYVIPKEEIFMFNLKGNL